MASTFPQQPYSDTTSFRYERLRMNRQLRRTTKKSDQKRDKEQERRKEVRRNRRQGSKSQASSGSASKASDSKTSGNKAPQKSSRGGRLQGTRQRLTGFLALMTVSLLVMNSIFPPEYSNDLTH